MSLTVPRATPRLIDRGDLLAALDRGAARKVTIISAPAGSGKTCLLRAWAERRRSQAHRLALLQVRRDQHDAQLFWLALLDAVRHATGAASGTEAPAATPDFNARAMVDRLLSEVADAGRGITLVVDVFTSSSRRTRSVQFGRLRTTSLLMYTRLLATRHDLRLRLHQLRLAGELDGDPRGGLALLGARDARASRCVGYCAVRRGNSSAAPANGGLGRGLAARGDLTGGPSRRRALRRGVLRQRTARSRSI